jgi:hypothetical protein
MADFESLIAVIQRLEAQAPANQEKTVANLKEMKAGHQEMMPR